MTGQKKKNKHKCTPYPTSSVFISDFVDCRWFTVYFIMSYKPLCQFLSWCVPGTSRTSSRPRLYHSFHDHGWHPPPGCSDSPWPHAKAWRPQGSPRWKRLPHHPPVPWPTTKGETGEASFCWLAGTFWQPMSQTPVSRTRFSLQNPSSNNHGSMRNWCISNRIVSFHLGYSFPLNHDYGRKGKFKTTNESDCLVYHFTTWMSQEVRING